MSLNTVVSAALFRLPPAQTLMHLPADLAFELLPLTLLSPGQLATVGQLVGRPDEVHRLEELGLREGTPIEMLQPGSPCIVRLGGNKLCFRGDEATHVLVRLGASA